MRKKTRNLLKFAFLSFFTLMPSINRCAYRADTSLKEKLAQFKAGIRNHDSTKSISFHELAKTGTAENFSNIFERDPLSLYGINNIDKDGKTPLDIAIERYLKNNNKTTKNLVEKLLSKTSVELSENHINSLILT